MKEGRAKVVGLLKDYKYDQILYNNLCEEIKRLKITLSQSLKLPGDMFRVELKLPDTPIRRRTEAENSRRYRQKLERSLGLCCDYYSGYDPVRTLKARREQQEIIRIRMRIIENSLDCLTVFQKTVINESIIYRDPEECSDSIAERLRVERNILYAERDRALNKLERLLISFCEDL